MSTLDKHAARTAGRIKHSAGGWFNNVGDQGYQRNGREEFTVVVGLEVSELCEEVFINATEDVTSRFL